MGRKGIPKDSRELILNLRKEGNTMREIAELVGVGLATVHKYLKEKNHD